MWQNDQLAGEEWLLRLQTTDVSNICLYKKIIYNTKLENLRLSHRSSLLVSKLRRDKLPCVLLFSSAVPLLPALAPWSDTSCRSFHQSYSVRNMISFKTDIYLLYVEFNKKRELLIVKGHRNRHAFMLRELEVIRANCKQFKSHLRLVILIFDVQQAEIL